MMWSYIRKYIIFGGVTYSAMSRLHRFLQSENIPKLPHVKGIFWSYLAKE